MSKEGTKLPQDVEGRSLGGAGSAAFGFISSSVKPATEIVIALSKPTSPVINPSQDVQGTHDAATSLVDEAKSIRSSSDGDVQDDVKNAPKPVAAAADGGKGKEKGAAVEADHAVHIWTERERRKKMKNMYSTVHSLLPRLPDKPDKATIVGETVDYIKTLQGTIQRLEKQKVERMRAQQLGVGSSNVAPAPPLMRHGTPAPATRERTLADMVHNWSTQQQAAARGSAAPPQLEPLQTWFAPNIALSVTGNQAFIGVCTPKQSYVLTKVLYVLEKYRIDVVAMNISSDQNQNLFYIHTRISAASARLAERLMMTAQDRYKLAVSEMLKWIAK